MKLTPEQKLCVEELYLHYAVPTDQLRRKPAVLSAIQAAFCNMTGVLVGSAELLRYMINRRKNQDWPRLGGRAHRFPQALGTLGEGHRSLLCDLYERLGVTSDELLLRPKLAGKLVEAFASEAGRILPVHVLVPAVLQLRKRGLLPTLKKEAAAGYGERRVAFGDVAEVVERYGTGTK